MSEKREERENEWAQSNEATNAKDFFFEATVPELFNESFTSFFFIAVRCASRERGFP